MTEAVADAIHEAVQSLEPEVARLELKRLAKDLAEGRRQQSALLDRRRELFDVLVNVHGDTRTSVAKLAGVTQTVVSLAIGWTPKKGGTQKTVPAVCSRCGIATKITAADDPDGALCDDCVLETA